MKVSVENKIATLDYEIEVTNCNSDLTDNRQLQDFLDKLERELNTMNEPRGDWQSNSEGLYCEVDGKTCLLYTSPSPRDQRGSRMPSSA